MVEGTTLPIALYLCVLVVLACSWCSAENLMHRYAPYLQTGNEFILTSRSHIV
jgi:hypothetical protein